LIVVKHAIYLEWTVLIYCFSEIFKTLIVYDFESNYN